jgi:hypothetical protein
MRARQAVVVAAVTGAVAAAAKPRRSRKPRIVEPQVPAQRVSGIEALGLGVEDLAVAEHDERDARLVEALDWPET